MDEGQVAYSLSEGVAVIRLNDPASLNAMTRSMGVEVLDALTRAGREARAVVLGGVGRAFCAGANLKTNPINLDDPGRDMGGDLDGVINPILYEMRTSNIPIVTAVRGAAAGVGCGLALAGDLIVAGDTAFFYQAFRHVGLSPDGGSSYLLVNTIGRPRAMEMMLLGEKLPAAKALEWGLINRLVADEAVDALALDLARQLADGPRSLGIIKRVAWAAMDAGFEAALSNERVAQREAGRTEDFVEGMSAFSERRAPVFKGR